MARKMPKEERREQLLSIADDIIRVRGADALTLITLAEQAGVSKPVAYEHFATREGLLSEMYRRHDEKVILAIQRSLDAQPVSLETAARAITSTYMDCALLLGPEYEIIISALQVYPEWSDLKVRIRDFFVNAYSTFLKPFCSSGSSQVRWVIVALFGATDEMARAVALKEVDCATAVDVLTQLFMASLSKCQA